MQPHPAARLAPHVDGGGRVVAGKQRAETGTHPARGERLEPPAQLRLDLLGHQRALEPPRADRTNVTVLKLGRSATATSERREGSAAASAAARAAARASTRSGPV